MIYSLVKYTHLSLQKQGGSYRRIERNPFRRCGRSTSEKYPAFESRFTADSFHNHTASNSVLPVSVLIGLLAAPTKASSDMFIIFF